MKNRTPLAVALVFAVVFVLGGITNMNSYSLFTVGNAGTYILGGTLPNPDETPVVTVYQSGGDVTVTILVSSNQDSTQAPGTVYSSWSGGTLQRGKFTLVDLLTDDQLNALSCVQRVYGWYAIKFEAVSPSSQFTVENDDIIVPSRDRNDLGTVINPDCTVQTVAQATVDDVYVVELNSFIGSSDW